jgi:hypothetical protein
MVERGNYVSHNKRSGVQNAHLPMILGKLQNPDGIKPVFSDVLKCHPAQREKPPSEIESGKIQLVRFEFVVWKWYWACVARRLGRYFLQVEIAL